jgi:hypothetical protein
MMPNARNDVVAFSTLHSWYKKLDSNGTRMYPYLKKGKEPRCMGFELEEPTIEHWWFTNSLDENDPESEFLSNYPVVFTNRLRSVQENKAQINNAISVCNQQWIDRTNKNNFILNSLKR